MCKASTGSDDRWHCHWMARIGTEPILRSLSCGYEEERTCDPPLACRHINPDDGHRNGRTPDPG